VGGLPANLPASLFVVLHQDPAYASRLPELLTRRGQLRARHPVHGETIAPGKIYVAPPDMHLMVRPGFVEVVRGPKENGHRPSVDVMFRTAARAYGPRVAGVLLTGYLDCGTAGLLSIKARGGLAVVQDPRDAAVAEMPLSALKHVEVDHMLPVREMPELVARLSTEPVAAAPAEHVSGALLELEGDEPGVPAELVCPLCQGRITESQVNGFQVFRCHVGHAFSLESLAVEQADEVERALWAASRALEESAALSHRLADSSFGRMKRKFEEREESQAEQAELIRRLLLAGAQLRPTDVRDPKEEVVEAPPQNR
jgi:two-component system chemotaxis response regulator CheB